MQQAKCAAILHCNLNNSSEERFCRILQRQFIALASLAWLKQNIRNLIHIVIKPVAKILNGIIAGVLRTHKSETKAR